MTCREYWTNNTELRHLTANANAPEPEGWDVIATLQAFLTMLRSQPQPVYYYVIDYGCGAGRLSAAFGPKGYLGLDINPAAIAAAKAANPEYTYQTLKGFTLPAADLLIAYTVCLHLDDVEIEQFLNGAAAAPVKRLLICEITGRQYRRLGAPPHAYNRDLDEYATLLEAHGYESEATLLRPYERYKGLQLVAGETRTPEIAMMLFRQQEPDNE